MQIENEKPETGLEPFVFEFFNNRVEELNSLKASLAQGEFKSLRDKAHAWKGYSRPYGFNTLESLAIELKTAADSEEISACKDVLMRTENYLHIKKYYII